MTDPSSFIMLTSSMPGILFTFDENRDILTRNNQHISYFRQPRPGNTLYDYYHKSLLTGNGRLLPKAFLKMTVIFCHPSLLCDEPPSFSCVVCLYLLNVLAPAAFVTFLRSLLGLSYSGYLIQVFQNSSKSREMFGVTFLITQNLRTIDQS